MSVKDCNDCQDLVYCAEVGHCRQGRPPPATDEERMTEQFGPPQEPCPHCKSQYRDMSFGLAGGGYGAYEYCVGCSHIFTKFQEHE